MRLNRKTGGLLVTLVTGYVLLVTGRCFLSSVYWLLVLGIRINRNGVFLTRQTKFILKVPLS